MEGRDIRDGGFTMMAVRHQGAHWASPLRSDLRRGVRMRHLVVSAGLSGWVR